MMKILLPAGAVAAVVVVVAVLWSMSGAGITMSDGSNGTENDPALVPVTEGVKYRDLREGAGNPVKHGEKVKVKYKGWLTDGTVFDSSDATEFSLNGVIKGWREGIPGMKAGGVRKLVISPDAGYGSAPSGKIPGDSTLIFEVTLITTSPAGKNARPAKPEKPKTLSDTTAPGADDPGLIEVIPGLKYRDIKVGNGTKTAEGATVTIDYTGWLLNGQPFDSSVINPEPATFPLGSLIPGWQKGIPGMMPGGIRKLVIGPELGYRNQKKGDIPPGSTLVFEIELYEAR
jgi:peptidylprolyl isomerase